MTVSDLLRAALNLPLFALVICRSSGIMLAAPVLSSISIPARVKVALTFMLALLMYPFAAHYAGEMPSSLFGHIPLFLTELGLGLVMGFAGSMVLAALRVAGGLAAQQIGMAMAHVASPDLQEQSNALATLLAIFGVLLFLAVDGHHWFIQALAVSYRDIPLGEVTWRPEITESVFGGFSNLFIYALRAAAPMMGIMFLVTVMIALIAKSVPQMNILMVGYPVKVFVGVTALALTFPLIWPVMREAFRGLHAQLLDFARIM